MIVRCVLPDILMIIFAMDLGGGAIFEGVIVGGIGWVQTDAKLDSDKFDDSRRTKPAGLVESSQGVGAPLQTPSGFTARM